MLCIQKERASYGQVVPVEPFGFAQLRDRDAALPNYNTSAT
jgi:hypothetical protein